MHIGIIDFFIADEIFEINVRWLVSVNSNIASGLLVIFNSLVEK